MGTTANGVPHRVADAVAEAVAHSIVDVEGVIERTMWSPVYLPYRAA